MGESSQHSLKGKIEKRKKWKMAEKEKSDLISPDGDNPSDKQSSSGTGIQWKSEVSKDSFYIREDGVKLHKIPEDGWSDYPPTRILHDFCCARCIKKPEINLIDADGEAHCPVFTFEAKCFYLGSYFKVEAIQASKKNARNLAAQFLYDELSSRYQKYLEEERRKKADQAKIQAELAKAAEEQAKMKAESEITTPTAPVPNLTSKTDDSISTAVSETPLMSNRKARQKAK